MTYNLDLEERIDRLKDRLGLVTKKRMFGGIGYLFNGNMCFGIYHESLVLRTTPELAQKLLKNEFIAPFDITGKPMKGWPLVGPDFIETDEQLQDTLKMGFKFAATLPRKS